MRWRAAISGFLLLSAVTASGDTLFPERMQVLGQNFEKLGEHRYTYGLFFDLYEVALFVSPEANAKNVLAASSAFHLQFRYLRKIEKNIILKSAARMLERNLSAQQRASIAERVDQINQAYSSVGDGDASSLTYRPGRGTTLRINDKNVVTIPGQDFARLYFEIWLGEEPISSQMKEELLGLDE